MALAKRVGLLMGVAVLVACASALAAGSSSAPRTASSVSVLPDGDWTRFDYDAQRSGVGPASGITAGNLGLLSARVVNLPGTVDASPVQLHAIKVGGLVRDVVFLTTTYGRTLAFDPANGQGLWQFVPNHIGRFEGGYRITTATPAIDPDRSYLYAASPDGFIHKLSVLTGRQVWATGVTWDATHEKIASALNISGRYVIATTGGYVGDAPPYQGHVVVIDRFSGRRLHVWNSLCALRRYLIHPPSTCSSSDSAVWGRSGAVVQPRSGRLLLATGNGPFNGSNNWGDSMLMLSRDGARLLRHWTPGNQQFLYDNDLDVGSTAPAVLPGGGLAVQGGKAGVLDLLDLNHLYTTSGSGAGHLGGQRQEIPTPGGAEIFTAPAVWRHNGVTYVFVADGRATAGYYLGSDRRLHLAWEKATAGTSPVLAGGLLFVYDPGGALDVRSPTTGRLLRSLGAVGGHWNSPIVVGGRIILPVGSANDHVTSGQVYVYHLPGL